MEIVFSIMLGGLYPLLFYVVTNVASLKTEIEHIKKTCEQRSVNCADSD